MKKWLVILGVVLLVVLTGYKVLSDRYFGPEQVMCTMDAQLCPDGSSVGRMPPNCEFAPCPSGDGNIDQDNNPRSCGVVIPSLTEGPYYKAGSPNRTNLLESGVAGEAMTITGVVYDGNCQPIANAWLDFWQADGNGAYDNQGYKLRGHQYTDGSGKYMLETVIPGEYPGRTPHIHVKVRASESVPIITTQLYMPGEESNSTDSIFNESLVMQIMNTGNGKRATFDFVIPGQ